MAEPRGGYGRSNIFARRFDSTGTAQAAEFRVNTYTLYTQRYPAVATDADGDFVVAWDSRNQDGGVLGNYGVFARRFGSAGNPLAAEFQVNTYTITDQFFATVASADSGAFVVAWQAFQDGAGLGVFGRRFSSAGAPIGGEFQVNARTAGDQSRAAIGATGDGAFLVAWTHGGGDGSGEAIVGRRFTSSAAPETGEIQVNSFTIDDQRFPAVALGDDGGYVVVWQSAQQDGFGFGVFGSRVPGLAKLDIDGDGIVAPLTDGLLFLRDSFGFSGSTLTGGAVDADCTRCTAGAIAGHIDGLGLQLDIDGNGSLQPLTDGLLVLRYIFGFRGSTLIGGAVGQMCSRCTAEQIEPYLGSLVAIPTDPI